MSRAVRVGVAGNGAGGSAAGTVVGSETSPTASACRHRNGIARFIRESPGPGRSLTGSANSTGDGIGRRVRSDSPNPFNPRGTLNRTRLPRVKSRRRWWRWRHRGFRRGGGGSFGYGGRHRRRDGRFGLRGLAEEFGADAL